MIVATVKDHRLRVSGTIAASVHGAVTVSWRARSFGRTLGRGSRSVDIHSHMILLGFDLAGRALRGITVAVRSGSNRVIAGAVSPPHHPDSWQKL